MPDDGHEMSKSELPESEISAENLSPERALVDAAAVEHYDDEMRFFALSLVELNVNIYIVERVLEFPVDLFLGVPDRTFFLGQVVANFFDICVLLMTKLVADPGPDTRTVRRFRKWLVTEGIKPEHRKLLKERLRRADFRGVNDELLWRLRELRNHHIAHFIQGAADKEFGQRTAPVRVHFDELKALRDELNRLLDALSLDTEYVMLPLSYEPGRSDIEEFLDGIARVSDMLNMPEQHPERWDYVRTKLTPEEMNQLNEYRRKFGKGAV